jgi:GR25 family glycosyltransferase involved in LPS biosynthesis
MIIDKTYCINLDRRPDRWKEISDQFSREELSAERFAAVDGRDFKKEYPSSPGNNGCTLSHYFLIERARILGLDNVLIFEDDADLIQHFMIHLQDCINDLPGNWDMLLLGASHKAPLIPVTDKICRVQESYCTHAYLLRSTMFDLVIENFKRLDVPVDCFFQAWQKEKNIYITNPPLAWQRKSHSDIQDRIMHYPWQRTNDQK